MDLIIHDFSLNKEQTPAFRIIADHSLGHGKFGPQLRMGIFGEGGTRKSILIEAIRAWFACIRRQDELAATSTTGAAAHNINGRYYYPQLPLDSSSRQRVGQWDSTAQREKRRRLKTAAQPHC